MARTSPRGTDIVAVILAVGICTATNMFTVAVLFDAMFNLNPGLSENATQVLTGWGGGIIGVIGAVVGYRVGASAERADRTSYEAGQASTSTEPPSTGASA